MSDQAISPQLVEDFRKAVDPVYWSISELSFHPDPWQKIVLRGIYKRAILNCSRQSGKSTTAAIKSLHRAIYYPQSLILLLSPSLRQSGELFRKVTEFVKTARSMPKRVEDSKLYMTFANGSRIISLPGKEATVRGYSGVSLLIEDEASQCPDSLYFSVRPMLAVSHGDIILMSTPRGKRGHFYYEWVDGKLHEHDPNNGWKKFEVLATDCPRITQDFLQGELEALGPRWYRQEYGCSFEDTEDAVFTQDLINSMLVDGERDQHLYGSMVEDGEKLDIAQYVLNE